MSNCHIDGCGRPTGDLVCSHHIDRLRGHLDDIANIADDLNTTLTRQGKTTHGGGKKDKGEAQPLAFHAGASEVIAVVRNTLVSWVRTVHPEDDAESGQPVEPWPADTLPAMARYLAHHVDWARTDVEGPQMADEIEAARADAYRCVDRPLELVYAGRCDAEDGCGEELYAKVGADTITCRKCGQHYDVLKRRADLLAAVDDVLLPAADIARALPSLMETRVTLSQIGVWRHRNDLLPFSVRADGRELYRVGDVVALIERSARWKADREARRQAKRTRRRAA